MYIQKTYLVKQPHSGRCGRNDVVDKEEEGIFGPQVDSFPNEEVELPHFRNEKQMLLHILHIFNTIKITQIIQCFF